MATLFLPGELAPERKASVPMTAHGTPRVRLPRANEGRPTFEPTAAQRQTVTVWRGTGIAPADIARQIGVSLATLNKHFADEMAHGKSVVVSRISAQVVKKALAGDNSMIIFYLKNHGGEAWKDKQRLEHTGPDGTPLEPPNLVISFLAIPSPDDDASA